MRNAESGGRGTERVEGSCPVREPRLASWSRSLPHCTMPDAQQCPATSPIATFSGVHCTLEILLPHEGIVLLIFNGHDIGEFGDAPFRELSNRVQAGSPMEIFVDARAVPSASIEVSGEWAQWMRANRDHIYRMNMLCRSRFIELTANFVQRFTEFGSRMRIYTDEVAFDEALRTACGHAEFARSTEE